MPTSQASTGNVLLRQMLPADFARIAPAVSRIALPVRFQLHAAGHKIDHVYFPEDGLISIVAVTLDGKSREVGLFGSEGMSETATVLGTDHSPYEAYVQGAGVSCLKLPIDVLNRAFEESMTLRRHLLHYVQAMMIQLSTSIVAAGQTIPQQLARWILMCHDRVDGDTIVVTHDFIGMMLGVRRPGVTEAMLAMADGGSIVTRRGAIHVVDRRRLEAIAESGYGLAETEYARLIGVDFRRGLPEPAVPRIAAE